MRKRRNVDATQQATDKQQINIIKKLIMCIKTDKTRIIKGVVLLSFLLLNINVFCQRDTTAKDAYLRSVKLCRNSYTKEQLIKICIKEYSKTNGFKECYWPKAEYKSFFYYIYIDTVGENIRIDIFEQPIPLRRYERLYPEEERFFPNKYIRYKDRLFVYKDGTSRPDNKMLSFLDKTGNYAHTKYEEGGFIISELAEDRRFIVKLKKQAIDVFLLKKCYDPWPDGSFKLRPEDRDTLSFKVGRIANADSSLLAAFDSITSAMNQDTIAHYQYGLVSIENSDSGEVATIKLANICDFQTTDSFVGYVEGKKLTLLFRKTDADYGFAVDNSKHKEIKFFKIDDLSDSVFFEDKKQWPCAWDNVTKHLNLIFYKSCSGWHFGRKLLGPSRDYEFFMRGF